ncbi:winged helix-turn-helix domain-containing protein [Pasteurella atlantica]|uniref:winged helix-turn-helix domain-containing protein n=1 Tax=Pasteurellaceae TaxID=712 RepID=UPI0027626603|nr:winged helix-turn-helix domain-containing protein [Pasteurella atlantica]MDP8034392.1 winged helix-turn-helix domain-containing protein [Pasteurella atlantica]MDP8036299.1 winged helix-turn-helix domain-containing protein [Pasteurella atlantica]MDP8038275.1 winged helix-turn-helix domain-containing protein [Pasteurella atlantica]MDP8048628.1 winged helix-turn-helix domain-containing protein [Pasteurella atlantica]MDP8050561.1 winged helix-turn-helix domain-containing protein [Pasteurella at
MLKILLVNEDRKSIQSLIEIPLSSDFSLDISCRQNVLSKIAEYHYNLILLDTKNNLEILKQIRQQYHIPIMILTEYNEEIERIEAFELGADDYLVRPFSHREFSARINAILRRAYNTIIINNKKLQFCGVELNINSQQALYNDKDLHLTNTEFNLLKILVDNPGKIFSRETLSVKVLDKALNPYDRAIDMHISNLRKKLPKREDNLPWFKTLRGKGYFLIKE